MHNWCLEVWGDYACFTRPEMKVERVSYDVITPSAARAIFESILWKPNIKWNITRVEVLNPVKWTSVRRNEVGQLATSPTAKQMAGETPLSMGIYIEKARQQKAGLFLKDVRYRLHGYFDFLPGRNNHNNPSEKNQNQSGSAPSNTALLKDEKPAKYAAMFERRAKKGQCFHRPYLGCREFACNFKLLEAESKKTEPIKESLDLGFMLYDMDFSKNPCNPQPLFFRAIMTEGTINTDRREIEVRG